MNNTSILDTGNSIKKKNKIAIIGLGYVGLPLAIEFSKKREVIGFDTNLDRLNELNKGYDRTKEFSKSQLSKAKKLLFTNNKEKLRDIKYYIIAVPTPINNGKNPNLKLLINATKIVASVLTKGSIVIYESTVFPGCTEENCVPVLERFSKLKYNQDFFCGYSPERINPGDKNHKIQNIVKITSGSNPSVANLVDKLYSEIIKAGTYRVKSIKIAEAAKVIENCQRDLNIAFVNELALVFNKMHINLADVLDAASTKWNFLKFKPGLVGGHCIGVDPYYLTFKSKILGHNPKVILSGRKINDGMPSFVISKLFRLMKKKSIKINGAKILVMGLTFKENCTDLRNSGAEKVINKLKKYKCKIDLFDPLANHKEVLNLYGIKPLIKLDKGTYDAILITVAHKEFKKKGAKYILQLTKSNHVIFDLKNLFTSNFESI